MLAAALADETTGVNAQLDTVPRDAGDPRPPDVVGVLDQTLDDLASRDPEGVVDWPVIIVRWVDLGDLEGTSPTGHRDALTAVVAAGYVTRKADTAAALRDAGYTLRAMQRALRALDLKDPNTAQERLRNGISLRAKRSLAVPGPLTVLENGVGVVAALHITCEVRDTEP